MRSALGLVLLTLALARTCRGDVEPFRLAVTVFPNAISGQISGPENMLPSGRFDGGTSTALQLDYLTQHWGVQYTHAAHTTGVPGPFQFNGYVYRGATLAQDLEFIDVYGRIQLYADPACTVDATLGLDTIVSLDTVSQPGLQTEANHFTPLPTVGLLGRFRMSESLFIRTCARGFTFSNSKFESLVYNAAFEVGYTFPYDGGELPIHELSFGVQFLEFDLKTAKDKPDEAEGEYKLFGPFARASAYF